MWALHDGFKSLVQSVWVNSAPGNAMLSCMTKLKRVKQVLKFWNKEVFWNLHTSIASARVELQKTQLQLVSEGFSKLLFNLENEAHSRLDGFSLPREFMYKYQCRVNWLHHVDRNSTYFHNMLKVHKTHKPINALNINRSIVLDKVTISNHAVDFYPSLFKKMKLFSIVIWRM